MSLGSLRLSPKGLEVREVLQCCVVDVVLIDFLFSDISLDYLLRTSRKVASNFVVLTLRTSFCRLTLTVSSSTLRFSAVLGPKSHCGIRMGVSSSLHGCRVVLDDEGEGRSSALGFFALHPIISRNDWRIIS
jgi:hypothetical protein